MDPADQYTHAPADAGTVATAARFPHPDAPPLHWWDLLWKLIRFQFKLVLDGIRDLLLGPVAVAAVLVGLVFEPRRPERYLAQLMQLGQRSDRWINLFSEFAHDHTADALVEPLERAARARYEASTRRRGPAQPADPEDVDRPQ